jgi:hypothetical protein
MKKCPFCAEQIQDEAIKCRFCGEFLDGRVPASPDASRGSGRDKSQTKWYFSTSAVIIAVLCAGPFALPLIWLHPRYKIVTKFVGTILVIAATIGCIYLAGEMYRNLIKQVEALGIH